MFWVYSIGLWLLVAVIAFFLYASGNEFWIVTLLALAVVTQIYMPRNGGIIGNEYKEPYENRYTVKVIDDSYLRMSFNADGDDEPDYRDLQYTRHGNVLEIDQDDVYDNYKDIVVAEKIVLSDHNKKAQIYQTCSYSDGDKVEKYTVMNLIN